MEFNEFENKIEKNFGYLETTKKIQKILQKQKNKSCTCKLFQNFFKFFKKIEILKRILEDHNKNIHNIHFFLFLNFKFTYFTTLISMKN